MTALTHAQRLDRDMLEADLQRLVTDMAALLGWSYVHFRAGQTHRGWRVPVEGPLGAGWPDLVLVRVRDQRLLFVELKRELGQVTADQAAVLAALGEVAEAVVWRPSDLSDGHIQEVLT
jgi:hypothetical protein